MKLILKSIIEHPSGIVALTFTAPEGPDTILHGFADDFPGIDLHSEGKVFDVTVAPPVAVEPPQAPANPLAPTEPGDTATANTAPVATVATGVGPTPADPASDTQTVPAPAVSGDPTA